jgi:hypothetical protein
MPWGDPWALLLINPAHFWCRRYWVCDLESDDSAIKAKINVIQKETAYTAVSFMEYRNSHQPISSSPLGDMLNRKSALIRSSVPKSVAN